MTVDMNDVPDPVTLVPPLAVMVPAGAVVCCRSSDNWKHARYS
jgi:hypothetical protein